MARTVHDDPAPICDLDLRHRGLTAEVSAYYCQAAAVCLSVHHLPPHDMRIAVRDREMRRSVTWEPPGEAGERAHANRPDARRDGAYALAILGTEWALGLEVIGRSEQGSGSDWYAAPPGEAIEYVDGYPILDGIRAVRLEVSGTDQGTLPALLRKKLDQLEAGDSAIPGIAAVVGFERVAVLIDGALAEGDGNDI